MTRYLTVDEVIMLYQQVMQQSGGFMGIRDILGLESAVLHPRATFGGNELYISLAEKAGSLAYGLIQNHPFIDGNKRIGHAAMEVFLILNGYELQASIDEQEQIILGVASNTITREQLTTWIAHHLVIKQ
jgi:death-on-curing protein